jgi:hypothetical protein
MRRFHPWKIANMDDTSWDVLDNCRPIEAIVGTEGVIGILWGDVTVSLRHGSQWTLGGANYLCA